MSNNSLLLVDPDFKAGASQNCHLLLKITNDSFSYAIIDKDSKHINVIFDKQDCKDIESALQNAFENDNYLSQNYAVVKAAIHTQNFTFIPDDWFNADQTEVYARYFDNEGKIHHQHHSELGFNTVFSLNEKIEKQIPISAELYAQSAPLLALINHLTTDALLIDFTANSFNILYIKDKKVHFQNHYQAENTEEFNYFLLLIIEQLNLNDAIPVYLQGIINEDDDYYDCLLKYFNQLYFFLPAEKQHSELLADMPKHYFSGLLALDLCE